MAQITKLTTEQEKRLVEFRKEWLDIGLCCEPADFANAEETITYFYSKLGKPRPLFFRFSSPLMCEFGIVALKVILNEKTSQNLWSQLWSQLESQLESQLRSQLRSQLESQLRSQLGSQLESQLESQLRSQLWSQLRSQLWSQLRSQLWIQLGSQLGSQSYFYYNCFGGQHAAAWKAFYLFCHEIGVKYGEDDLALLNAWVAIAKSVCWWAPWEGICILSDRPRHVSFDSNGRLHNETRMAVEFSDGWGVHAWHGVRIPAWIIDEPQKLNSKMIDQEQNAEIRRVMMNKHGMAKYFEETGATEIDRDRDTKGERILYQKQDSVGKIQIIKLENSTPERNGESKHYVFRVPPTVKTCQEAVAYLYSRDPKKYRPAVET